MEAKVTVAVPTNIPGGMEASISDHFGHCDVFTLIKIAGQDVEEVLTVDNVPHVQGGCMAPVNLLADHGVQVLVAGGMGMRPLMGFNSVGIEVFHNRGLRMVNEVVGAFMSGQLPRFTQEFTCGGGGHGAEQGGGCGGH